MNQNSDLIRQIETLNQNITLLIQTLKELIQIEETKKSKKRTKSPHLPLTEGEVIQLKSEFDLLYSRWNSGNEHDVRNDLEAMPFDQLRRFADANNLTVGKKATKDNVLRAILTRFREKKMLYQGMLPSTI